MALMHCPECGKEISDTCDACIHCGYRFKKNDERKTKAIAYHVSTPGWLTFFLVLCVIFGVFFLGIGGLLLVLYAIHRHDLYLYFLVMGLISLALGVLLFITFIIDIVRIGENGDIPDPCIAYDSDADKLVLYALNGKKIAIGVEQYLDISCGFFTDGFLIVAYRDDRQRKKKARLGFTSNRWDAQKAIILIRERR